MRTRELRGEARTPVSQKAVLSSGVPPWLPCRVMNMSDNGLSIICTKQFPVGQVLEFKCELYPERHLECKIEIRHVSAECMGAKIVEINKQAMKLYQLFLEEEYSAKLNRFHPL
jgi:PilZ domain